MKAPWPNRLIQSSLGEGRILKKKKVTIFSKVIIGESGRAIRDELSAQNIAKHKRFIHYEHEIFITNYYFKVDKSNSSVDRIVNSLII